MRSAVWLQCSMLDWNKWKFMQIFSPFFSLVSCKERYLMLFYRFSERKTSEFLWMIIVASFVVILCLELFLHVASLRWEVSLLLSLAEVDAFDAFSWGLKKFAKVPNKSCDKLKLNIWAQWNFPLKLKMCCLGMSWICSCYTIASFRMTQVNLPGIQFTYSNMLLLLTCFNENISRDYCSYWIYSYTFIRRPMDILSKAFALKRWKVERAVGEKMSSLKIEFSYLTMT